MKSIVSIASCLVLFGIQATAQDKDSSLSNLLENPDLQNILKSAKDDPGKAVEAVKSNPDEMVRSATAIFADQTKKQDSNDSPPATRSSKTQTDKALSSLRAKFADPSQSGDNSNTGTSEMSNRVNELKKEIDGQKLNELKNEIEGQDLNEMKKAATDAVPALSRMIPDDPAPEQPSSSGPPPAPVRQIRPVEPAAGVSNQVSGSPMQVRPGEAPAVPRRTLQATESALPEIPELFSGSAPAPEKVKPRYAKPEKFRPAKDLKPTPSKMNPEDDTIVITANESEMDNKRNTLTFRGDVEAHMKVQMRDTELSCDNLVVKLEDVDGQQRMQEIIASGGMVEIKRIGENGQLQVAKARKAVYLSASGTMTLTGGPPYLQNGDQYVNTDSNDARILLTNDGKYRVDTPKGSGRSVIVVPIGGGKGIQDLGFEKKLNVGQ